MIKRKHAKKSYLFVKNLDPPTAQHNVKHNVIAVESAACCHGWVRGGRVLRSSIPMG